MNCLKTDSTVRMILSHCCDALVTVASKAGGNSSAHSNKLLRLTFDASNCGAALAVTWRALLAAVKRRWRFRIADGGATALRFVCQPPGPSLMI